MKKLCIFLAFICVALLCSCNKEPEIIPAHIEGVLYFSDKSETYSGCAVRAQEVITVLTEKANMVIEQNNALVEDRVPEKYFLEPDYILTNFCPFATDYFAYSLSFSDESAGQFPATVFGEDASAWFEKTDKNAYRLTVEAEESEFELTGEYSRKNNSLHFCRSTYDDGGKTVEEFLDFVNIEGNGYYLQNAAERCVIDFDENGNVNRFYFSRLADGAYDKEGESVYPDGADIKNIAPEEWVYGAEKNSYICIYSYSGGVLTFDDRSSGEWKTVKTSEQSEEI